VPKKRTLNQRPDKLVQNAGIEIAEPAIFYAQSGGWCCDISPYHRGSGICSGSDNDISGGAGDSGRSNGAIGCVQTAAPHHNKDSNSSRNREQERDGCPRPGTAARLLVLMRPKARLCLQRLHFAGGGRYCYKCLATAAAVATVAGGAVPGYS